MCGTKDQHHITKKTQKPTELRMFIFAAVKKNKNEPKGEVKNHNHTASTTFSLRKANLQRLEFVLLPLFLILHLAHFDFHARKLSHNGLVVERQVKQRKKKRKEDSREDKKK